MDKKLFYHFSLYLLLGTWFFLSNPSSLAAAESVPVTANKATLEVLTDLDRHYSLSFLWFNHLASGQLSFSPDPSAPNRYRALLDARTLGVAAWLTGDRMQRYESLMEMTPQGRLQTLEYKSMIHKNKGGKVVEQSKAYTFNAATRTIMMTRSKAGKQGKGEPIKVLSERFPVDFLTAGFNFILGADGPIRAGERKEIVTFDDKKEQKIVIEVLSPDAWPKTSFFPKGSGTLLKIILPTDILDTSDGAVYALLDEKFLPSRVIVKNVLGLGDVRCELRP
jgi:hypothetical protein